MTPRRRPRKEKNQQKLIPAPSPTDKLLREIITQTHANYGDTPPVEKDIPFPMLRRNKIYTFARTTGLPSIVQNSALGVDTQFAYNFTLSNLPDATDFTNLFDQYRIQQVRVSFTSNVNPTTFGSVLHTVLDYDDSSLISVAQAQEYATHQTTKVGTSLTRVLQPRFALAAFGGSVFTSFANADPSTWVDVASSGVQYFGVKGILPGNASATSGAVYDVQYETIIQFRNTR